MSESDVPQWVGRLTEEFSTDRFGQNYKGFLYNHMYQGIIALWQLEATEAQTRMFAENLSKSLEPVEIAKGEVIPSHKLLSAQELKDLQGARQKYLHLVAHFRQHLVDLDNDWGLFVNREFPSLAPGVAASALHGIIQIGYGYLAKDERLFCEGFAYMHYQYLPHNVTSEVELIESVGSGNEGILDVLRAVRMDGSLLNGLQTDLITFNDERDGAPFLRKIHTLLMLKGDSILKLVTRVKLPEFFDKERIDTDQLKKIADWIIDCAILVYGMVERKNDFFLLHGITGAWSLRQILPLLQNKDEALKIVAYFLSALFAVYITQGCPEIKESNLDDVNPATWEEIKKKCLEITLEEHVYKLVHVCQTRCRENADPTMLKRYQQVAHLVTYNPFLLSP